MFEFLFYGRRILAELEVIKTNMTGLNESVQELRTAVTGVAERVGELTGPLQERITELQTALDAERVAYEEYRNAEDAEDVGQNAALDEARAATDAAMAEANTAAQDITTQVEELNRIAAPTQEV